MKKILIILCLPVILFSCTGNNENNATTNNYTTESSDTLLQIPTDENGNHGVYIRNFYTIYNNTKNNQQYGDYLDYCAVDEYIYSNEFRKYMLRFNFHYNYTNDGYCPLRLNFTEEELPYLSEFLESCINYKKDERENVTKCIQYDLMTGTGFLSYAGKSDGGISLYDRNDNLAYNDYNFNITPLELKNIVAGGREKIAELRRDNDKKQQADTLAQKQ